MIFDIDKDYNLYVTNEHGAKLYCGGSLIPYMDALISDDYDELVKIQFSIYQKLTLKTITTEPFLDFLIRLDNKVRNVWLNEYSIKDDGLAYSSIAGDLGFWHPFSEFSSPIDIARCFSISYTKQLFIYRYINNKFSDSFVVKL